LQTMGEMASEIAHELNQPLGAIVNYARGAANRLRDHVASEDEILSLLEKIAGQALRGGDLIRKIRTFAKKAEIDVNENDLNKLVRDAVGLVMAGGRSFVPIRLELEPELPDIQVDEIQIEQVIVNLVRNGLDAVDGREDAVVTITTERSGTGEVRLTVADNGPGFAATDTEKIFEAFYTTKPGGLGLGLPISRSIVQAHGGSLSVENGSEGGTRFHVMLPSAVN
jgi:C4-dicarboxylate-specific signal transduction histidine kinase